MNKGSQKYIVTDVEETDGKFHTEIKQLNMTEAEVTALADIAVVAHEAVAFKKLAVLAVIALVAKLALTVVNDALAQLALIATLLA